MSTFTDMEDILQEIEDLLKNLLSDEEKRLEEEKLLLTTVYEALTDQSDISQPAEQVAEVFAYGFIEDFCPTLSALISTE